MKFDEYNEQAVKTAAYPTEPKILAYSYASLGLAEETGEVVGKIKKMIRDDNCNLSEERRDSIKLELGDVLWYWFALCREFEFEPSDVAQTNLNKLFKRQKDGTIKGDGDYR